MATNDAQKLVLHRFAVIAEAIDPHLSPTERGAAVRSIAGRSHQHPDGSARRYSRSTVDRFVRAYRA
jgi:putative transposase